MTTHTTWPVPSGAHEGEPTPLPPILAQPVHATPLPAIIRGVTGYLIIRHPDAGTQGVTMPLAALFIVGGLFRGAAASAIQFPRWGWTVFSGLLSVALGIYLFHMAYR